MAEQGLQKARGEGKGRGRRSRGQAKVKVVTDQAKVKVVADQAKGEGRWCSGEWRRSLLLRRRAKIAAAQVKGEGWAVVVAKKPQMKEFSFKQKFVLIYVKQKKINVN